MKKIFAAALAFVMLFALASCGENAFQTREGTYREKDGDDHFTEEKITAESTEKDGSVAVFDDASSDGQNPVVNFIGNYVSGRARALVEADGSENAKITIRWSGSADSLQKWVIQGKFHKDTLSILYQDAVVSGVIYHPDGTVKSETLLTDHDSGSITFKKEGGSFLWKDDQLTEDQQNMEFEWAVIEENDP